MLDSLLFPLFQVANGQQLWIKPVHVQASHIIHKWQLGISRCSKEYICLSIITKHVSWGILSAVAFCSKSKTSNVISKDIRVTNYNLNLLDWYLSSGTSALPSDLIMCCMMMSKRGQQGKEQVELRETGLWVRRDILLQRRPLSNGQIISPLCQNALADSGILCWGIQEGSPDSTGSLPDFQAHSGLTPKPSILHLQCYCITRRQSCSS